jgi:hypothetical protein
VYLGGKSTVNEAVIRKWFSDAVSNGPSSRSGLP